MRLQRYNRASCQKPTNIFLSFETLFYSAPRGLNRFAGLPAPATKLETRDSSTLVQSISREAQRKTKQRVMRGLSNFRSTEKQKGAAPRPLLNPFTTSLH